MGTKLDFFVPKAPPLGVAFGRGVEDAFCWFGEPEMRARNCELFIISRIDLVQSTSCVECPKAMLMQSAQSVEEEATGTVRFTKGKFHLGLGKLAY